jgi:DNA-binding NtrC family response regulator
MSPEMVISSETVLTLLPHLLERRDLHDSSEIHGTEQDSTSAGQNVRKVQACFSQVYEGMNYKEAKKEFDRLFIQLKLQENSGNVSKTAEQIGMERSHLHKKMKTLDV